MIAGYIRVSTEDQDYGAAAQRAEIERYAKVLGESVIDWHEDRACGATPTWERKGLKAAVEALSVAPKGEPRILLAGKRDRLARDVATVVEFEQIAKENHISVVTADGVTTENTPAGRLIRGVFDLFAQYERDMIQARTREAFVVKRARRERTSRHAPYGFKLRNDGPYVEGKRKGETRWGLDEDPDEQQVLRLMLELAKTKTPGRIAKQFNRSGVLFRGGPWHKNTVFRILARCK